MGWVVLRRGFLGLVCLLLSVHAFADEGIILVAPGGALYKLEKKHGKPVWTRTNESILSTDAFRRELGTVRTVGGETQISYDGPSAVVRAVEDGRWAGTHHLPRLGEGEVYVAAHRDLAGNFYVQVNDSPAFAYFPKRRDFSLSVQDTGVSTANVQQILPNPFGEGLFSVVAAGDQLKLLLPPQTADDSFRVASWLSAAFLSAPIERLVIGEYDGRTVVVALTRDGKTGFLGLETSGPPPPDVTYEAIPLPSGMPGGTKRLVSSFDSRASQRVQAARLLASGDGTGPATTRATASVTATPTHSTALVHVPEPSSAGDRIEVRSGRPVRVSPEGVVVPEPASALARVSSHEENVRSFFRGLNRVLTDEAARDRHFMREPVIVGRRVEADRVLEVLVRTTGNHPIIVGDVGSGRTVMGQLLARLILRNEISPARRFQEVLRNAIVVETTGAFLESVGPSNFFASVKAVERATGRSLLVIANRLHDMSPEGFRSFKLNLEGDASLLCVGVLTPAQYTMIAQKDPELTKIFEPVRLKPFTEAEVRQVLTETIVPELERTYRARNENGKVTPEAIEVAIRRGRQLYPDLGNPEAPRKVLEDMMIRAHREAGAAAPVLTLEAARKFVKDRLELPFDIDNPEEFHDTIERYRAGLRDQIFEQDRIVDWLTDTYRDIMRPGAVRRHRSVMLSGPTGSGKTYTLKTAFEQFFGKDRVLVIDCSKYVEKEALTTLLGSWPGYIGSDKPGVLPAFLSGRGRFLAGIIFDDYHKASPELANAIMKLLDEGSISDSSGKEYHLGTAMVGFTTNKGTEKFFPRDGSLTPAEQRRRAEVATFEEVKQDFLEPDPNNRLDRTREHKPENMRRIDAAFYTLPPSVEGVIRILRTLRLQRLRTEKGITIEVDDAILEEIVRRRYKPQDGAPEVERVLTDLVNAAYARFAREIERLPAEQRPTLYLRWVPGADGAPAHVTTSLGSSGAPQTIAPAFVRDDVNPLEDPATRRRMRSLRDEILKHVFGQDPAVNAAAQSIINQRYFNPDPSRPSVLTFLGPTGTGKSELAEVIGEVEFGSRARCKSFQMSNIRTLADVDNLFGTARGRAASDTDAEFEGFVRRYEKEGGVLHFEEMGNVGADDPRVREAVFRILYSILLGTWTNPNGETFKTNKFVVVFSSNEGQELFQSSPSDDLRLATYNRANTQEYLHGLLRRAGWPEALLGRLQGNLILFKPLIAATRARIARKFVEEIVQKLRARYPIELDVDEQFYADLGETFFSHDRGARQMKDFAEKEFQTVLREAVLRIYDEQEANGTAYLRGCTFKFRITDSYAGQSYYVGPRPAERKVTLHLKVSHAANGQAFDHDLDVTSAAAERRLPSRRSLYRTAYHEAGHVIANDPRRTGVKIEHVTIIGKGNYGGYARWGELGPTGPISRVEAIAKIGMFLAGREAEILARLPADAGWSRDLEMARELAVACVSRYGLTDEALRLPVTHEGRVDFSKDAVQEEIRKLLAESQQFARARLTAHWPAVRLMAKRLLKHQFLEEAAINEILAVTSDEAYRTALRLESQRTPRAPRCDQRLVAEGP